MSILNKLQISIYRIKAESKTIDDVPNRWKDAVQMLLDA